jgi:hypothetical protein
MELTFLQNGRDESAWTLIKCALVDNNLGSRVIVTTRNAGVAQFSCSPTDGTMFELPTLSDTAAKTLFYKRIFSKEEIQSKLKEISCKILKEMWWHTLSYHYHSQYVG